MVNKVVMVKVTGVVAVLTVTLPAVDGLKFVLQVIEVLVIEIPT